MADRQEPADWRHAELIRDDAAAVAVWALIQKRRAPWWRFFRRRYLQGLYEAKCAEHERMVRALAE